MSGYRMLLPASWVRLSANPIAMRPVVRRLLLELWSDQPRDATAQRRRELEQRLVQLGSTAADNGGHELLVCLEVAGDVPLPASAVVSLHPTLIDDEAGLQQLAEASAAGAMSSEVLDLGRNRGVLVVRETEVDEPVPLPQDATPEQREALVEGLRRVRQVDVHLPVPGEPAMLLLSFSTPLAPLFEVFTDLFVSLASTVEWQRTGPSG
jgi:hypothetical protein